MKPRLDPNAASPDAVRALLALSANVASCGLERSLLDLVKIRASQINGCTYCLHMHTRDARARGETEERLYLLSAWRESALYTVRERAALEWTEALTRIADAHAPDQDYVQVSGQFSPDELVKLTVAIGLINAWNRLLVGFRAVHPVRLAKAA